MAEYGWGEEDNHSLYPHVQVVWNKSINSMTIQSVQKLQ